MEDHRMSRMKKATLLAALLIVGCGGVLAMSGAVRSSRSPAAAPGPGGPASGDIVLAATHRAPRPPEPPDPPDPPDPPESDSLFVYSGGGFLGVDIDDVDEDKAKDLKLSEPMGALVLDVSDDSPADKAGLKKDDVIVSFQGQRVESATALRRMVRETPPGRTVNITAIRDGSKENFTLEIASRRMHGFHMPDMRGWGLGNGVRVFGFGDDKPRLGVTIDALTPQLGEYFGVKDGEGILIKEVLDGTPAEKAGLRAGDVIIRVDDEKIEDLGDLHDALEDKDGDTVKITVMRDRRETTVTATLEKRRSRSRGERGGRAWSEDARLELERSLRESQLELRAALQARAQALRDLSEELSRAQVDRTSTLREAERARAEALRALEREMKRRADDDRSVIRSRNVLRSKLVLI